MLFNDLFREQQQHRFGIAVIEFGKIFDRQDFGEQVAPGDLKNRTVEQSLGEAGAPGGIRHLVDDDGDAVAGHHLLGAVVEFPGGGQHTRPDLVTDPGAPGKHPGNRRFRNAAFPGQCIDVGHRIS